MKQQPLNRLVNLLKHYSINRKKKKKKDKTRLMNSMKNASKLQMLLWSSLK